LWSDLDGDGIPDELRKRTRRTARPRTPAANGASAPEAGPAPVPAS
jgi:hypothetical protein